MVRSGGGWIRGLGALFGGGDGSGLGNFLGNHEVGGRFINVLGHPEYGVPAAMVGASVAGLISNPAAAAEVINGANGLARQPGVANLPGVVAALEAIVAASNPFNATAFNTGIQELEVALEGATQATAQVADTVGTTTGWRGWGSRFAGHLHNVRTLGHAGTHR